MNVNPCDSQAINVSNVNIPIITAQTTESTTENLQSQTTEFPGILNDFSAMSLQAQMLKETSQQSKNNLIKTLSSDEIDGFLSNLDYKQLIKNREYFNHHLPKEIKEVKTPCGTLFQIVNYTTHEVLFDVNRFLMVDQKFLKANFPTINENLTNEKESSAEEKTKTYLLWLSEEQQHTFFDLFFTKDNCQLAVYEEIEENETYLHILNKDIGKNGIDDLCYKWDAVKNGWLPNKKLHYE